MCVSTFQTFLVLIIKVIRLVVNGEANLPCFQPQFGQFPFSASTAFGKALPVTSHRPAPQSFGTLKLRRNGRLLICSSTATLHILSSATLNRHIKGSQTSDLVGFPLKAIWMISKNLGMLPPTVGYRHAKVWYLGGW